MTTPHISDQAAAVTRDEPTLLLATFEEALGCPTGKWSPAEWRWVATCLAKYCSACGAEPCDVLAVSTGLAGAPPQRRLPGRPRRDLWPLGRPSQQVKRPGRPAGDHGGAEAILKGVERVEAKTGKPYNIARFSRSLVRDDHPAMGEWQVKVEAKKLAQYLRDQRKRLIVDGVL